MPFDDERAARQADPVLAEFYGGTGCPTQEQLDYLLKRCGVPPMALAQDADGGGVAVGAANIVFDGDRLFDFNVEPADAAAAPALIFVARDTNGDPLDLVAWAPRLERAASRFGRASVLGEQSLHAFRLGDLPRIHRSILNWLRAGRDGIVVLDPKRAGRSLLDAPDRLVAEDKAHAVEIADIMSATVDLSRIVLPVRAAA